MAKILKFCRFDIIFSSNIPTSISKLSCCSLLKNLSPYVLSKAWLIKLLSPRILLDVLEVDNTNSVIVEPDLGNPIINIGSIFFKIFFVEPFIVNFL